MPLQLAHMKPTYHFFFLYGRESVREEIIYYPFFERESKSSLQDPSWNFTDKTYKAFESLCCFQSLLSEAQPNQIDQANRMKRLQMHKHYYVVPSYSF
jgi:hypothetical protein